MNENKPLKFKDLQNYALEPVSYYMKQFDCDTYPGMGMHQHQYFEIMYAYSGSFTLEIFNPEERTPLKRLLIRAGQFVVLDSFVFHRLVIDSNQSSFVYNIEFNPRDMNDYNPLGVNNIVKINFGALFTETNFKRIAFDKNNYAVLNDSHQVGSFFQELIRLLTNGIRSTEDACAMTLAEVNLFTEISKCLNPGNVGSLPYIRKTNAYIHENFKRKITMEEIAENVGISKAYLHRQYKKYTGQTILEYINTLRIQKAANLISFSALPIGQIAVQVGFSNKNQLNYEFKKVLGMTPSEYKRSDLSSVDHHYAFYDSVSISLPSEKL